jgi:hypothetical protein
VLRPVLGDRLLLFTELPRRGLLGNSAEPRSSTCKRTWLRPAAFGYCRGFPTFLIIPSGYAPQRGCSYADRTRAMDFLGELLLYGVLGSSSSTNFLLCSTYCPSVFTHPPRQEYVALVI